MKSAAGAAQPLHHAYTGQILQAGVAGLYGTRVAWECVMRKVCVYEMMVSVPGKPAYFEVYVMLYESTRKCFYIAMRAMNGFDSILHMMPPGHCFIISNCRKIY